MLHLRKCWRGKVWRGALSSCHPPKQDQFSDGKNAAPNQSEAFAHAPDGDGSLLQVRSKGAQSAGQQNVSPVRRPQCNPGVIIITKAIKPTSTVRSNLDFGSDTSEVENFFCALKQHRRIDKSDQSFRAMIHVVGVKMALNSVAPRMRIPYWIRTVSGSGP